MPFELILTAPSVHLKPWQVSKNALHLVSVGRVEDHMTHSWFTPIRLWTQRKGYHFKRREKTWEGFRMDNRRQKKKGKQKKDTKPMKRHQKTCLMQTNRSQAGDVRKRRIQNKEDTERRAAANSAKIRRQPDSGVPRRPWDISGRRRRCESLDDHTDMSTKQPHCQGYRQFVVNGITSEQQKPT